MTESHSVSLSQLKPFPSVKYTVTTMENGRTCMVTSEGMDYYELPDIILQNVPVFYMKDALQYVRILCCISESTLPKEPFITQVGDLVLTARFESRSKHPGNQYGRFRLNPIERSVI